MSASTTVTAGKTPGTAAPNSPYTTPAFWERLWRMSGINFIVTLFIAYGLYGRQPQVGASADALVAFYDGNHIRILIAAVFSGMSVLNLLWFAAALRTSLADAGQDGWGAAATASSSALGVLLLILTALCAALAYSIAGTADHAISSALNDFAWAGVVLSSFPRAMLIMAGSFGLWRARLISNGLFTAGVACVVLVLIGGTTWMRDGVWAADGAYSRYVSPAIGVIWVLVVSRVLLSRSPATRTGW